MSHPNFLDRLSIKIFPRYLYPGQLAATTGKIQIGIIHKLPQAKPYWQIMDYLPLERGSLIRFRGLARNLNLTGDIEPLYSVFDLVHIKTAIDVTDLAKHLSLGDSVIVLPVDRQFIYPAPEPQDPTSPADPVFYTAASPPLT